MCANDSEELENSRFSIEKQLHHEQRALCLNRPPYRQGRKLTAVKVYTVNDESKYLLISQVPDIKIGKELSTMCLKFGQVNCMYPLPDYPSNRFELTYLVKYVFLKNARTAKRKIDGKSFFGSVLHVCYAPELESVEETREKLTDRRKNVAFHNRLKANKGSSSKGSYETHDNFESTIQNDQIPINQLSFDKTMVFEEKEGASPTPAYYSTVTDEYIRNPNTILLPEDPQSSFTSKVMISDSKYQIKRKAKDNISPKRKLPKLTNPYTQPSMELLRKSAKFCQEQD